jgi:hypothetical protein
MKLSLQLSVREQIEGAHQRTEVCSFGSGRHLLILRLSALGWQVGEFPPMASDDYADSSVCRVKLDPNALTRSDMSGYWR